MSPIFRVKSELGLRNLLNTIWLHKYRSHFCHNFRHRKTWNDFVTDSRPRRSFLGLISVLNPIGLDIIKPRNYLIVRGLSRLFRISSEVHSGAGGTWTLVQTRNQCAFYVRILRLVFVLRQAGDGQPMPYPLKFRLTARGRRMPIPDLLTPPYRFVSGRRQSGDVPSSWLSRGLSWSTVLQSSSESEVVFAS